MGFLNSEGLAHFWSKIIAKLGLKMDKATYDPQGKGEDVYGYTDAAIAGLPVKRMVGTADAPIDIDALLDSGRYYISGKTTLADKYVEEVLLSGNPMDVHVDPEVSSVVLQRIVMGIKDLIRTKMDTWSPWDRSYYVLSEDPDVLDTYLPLTGGTLTGPLTLPAAPTEEMQAANKGYVDSTAGIGYTSVRIIPRDWEQQGEGVFLATKTVPKNLGVRAADKDDKTIIIWPTVRMPNASIQGDIVMNKILCVSNGDNTLTFLCQASHAPDAVVDFYVYVLNGNLRPQLS